MTSHRRYAVMLVPQFSDGAVIDDLRRRYDPQHEHFASHITLVFAFETEVPESDLIARARAAIIGHAPIDIIASGIAGYEGNLLFLGIKKGNDEIIALSDALYDSGIAERRREYCFIPHLTVGRLDSREAFAAAIRDTAHVDTLFRATADAVIMKRIEPDGALTVVGSVPLGA
jgi:2'-5' RNA ligase